MRAWQKIGEEASIVLVGNFNPSIFHPEWFIRHNIVTAWNYQEQNGAGDDAPRVAVLPDLAQVEFPDQRYLTVMFNKFVLRCARATEFLTIKDMAMSAFRILQETPVAQIGMNYQVFVRIETEDLWRRFGEKMAPKEPWLTAAPYINELDDKQKAFLGLLEMTMQMPRWDDLNGYIRPTLKAIDIKSRQLSLSINNHVVIDDRRATEMIDYLDEHWDQAMSFANDFSNATLTSQLGDE